VLSACALLAPPPAGFEEWAQEEAEAEVEVAKKRAQGETDHAAKEEGEPSVDVDFRTASARRVLENDDRDFDVDEGANLDSSHPLRLSLYVKTPHAL
jgi:hypothetical protein